MFFPFGFDNSLVVLLILQVVRKELPDEKVGSLTCSRFLINTENHTSSTLSPHVLETGTFIMCL